MEEIKNIKFNYKIEEFSIITLLKFLKLLCEG